MSHFNMSWDYAFNQLSFQNAIMLCSSIPKIDYGEDDEEEKTQGVDAFSWLAGLAGHQTTKDDAGTKNT